MLAIVVSEADDASVHVGEQLRAVADWETHVDDSRPESDGGGTVYRTDGAELRTFEKSHLDVVDAADAFADPALLVFASKHAGETGRLLTAHHTGNFGPAEYGGADGEFARACPAAHDRVLSALDAHAPDDYEVGMECTHHGPTEVGVPSMFVEVGSDRPQWDDPDAARAVAEAILDLRGFGPDAAGDDGTNRHVVGFGGGHYAPRFERIVRETDWAVGHLGADWCLDAMGDPAENRDVLRRAFEASAATRAVVAGENPEVRETVASMGYRVVGEDWLRATTGVPLSVVEAVEDRLGPVADGVALGDRAAALDTAEFDVVDLPAELADAAQGVDTDAARAAVTDVAVAVETSEGGTRLGARAAVANPGDRRQIVESLADVLAEYRQAVAVEDDAVVVTEWTFDPEKAQTLGISEGPAFGRLSAGQSVEVNGRAIDPEVVHTERVHRYPY
jgi:D-aminoacyl-tRNA deacylase